MTLAKVWVGLVAGSESEADQIGALEVYLGSFDGGTPKYDLQVSKVCGSCQDFESVMEEADPTGAWKSYCGQDVYGYDAPHSALVFHPLDPETGLPLAGVRNVGVSFQSTRLSIDWAFSTHFPKNVTETIAQTVETNFFSFATSFTDTYPLLVAASMGIITYGPDYIGAGASARKYDRSYLTAMPVQQAAVVSYYATAAYTWDSTDGCTQVGKEMITWGYSSGGGAVVFGTIALEGQGMHIVRTFSQAGVYSGPAIVQSLIGKFVGDMVSANATNFSPFFVSSKKLLFYSIRMGPNYPSQPLDFGHLRRLPIRTKHPFYQTLGRERPCCPRSLFIPKTIPRTCLVGSLTKRSLPRNFDSAILAWDETFWRRSIPPCWHPSYLPFRRVVSFVWGLL